MTSIKNSVTNSLNSAAATFKTVPGRMKASAVNGKERTVTAIKNNPGKTALVAGSTGALAAAGAVALLVTATSLTAGIALAVIAGFALAFAIYTAVQAKMKANVTAQPKAPVAETLVAEEETKQVSVKDVQIEKLAHIRYNTVLDELESTFPEAVAARAEFVKAENDAALAADAFWNNAGKVAIVAAGLVGAAAFAYYAPQEAVIALSKIGM